eukprot:7355899-Ditylum_brightwellii.AAC.1
MKEDEVATFKLPGYHQENDVEQMNEVTDTIGHLAMVAASGKKVMEDLTLANNKLAKRNLTLT